MEQGRSTAANASTTIEELVRIAIPKCERCRAALPLVLCLGVLPSDRRQPVFVDRPAGPLGTSRSRCSFSRCISASPAHAFTTKRIAPRGGSLGDFVRPGTLDEEVQGPPRIGRPSPSLPLPAVAWNGSVGGSPVARSSIRDHRNIRRGYCPQLLSQGIPSAFDNHEPGRCDGRRVHCGPHGIPEPPSHRTKTRDRLLPSADRPVSLGRTAFQACDFVRGFGFELDPHVTGGSRDAQAHQQPLRVLNFRSGFPALAGNTVHRALTIWLLLHWTSGAIETTAHLYMDADSSGEGLCRPSASSIQSRGTQGAVHFDRPSQQRRHRGFTLLEIRPAEGSPHPPLDLGTRRWVMLESMEEDRCFHLRHSLTQILSRDLGGRGE